MAIDRPTINIDHLMTTEATTTSTLSIETGHRRRRIITIRKITPTTIRT